MPSCPSFCSPRGEVHSNYPFLPKVVCLIRIHADPRGEHFIRVRSQGGTRPADLKGRAGHPGRRALIKGAALALAALAVLAGGSGILSGGGDRGALTLAASAMCLFGCIGLFYKIGLGMGAAPAAMTVAQSIGVFCSTLPFFILMRDPLPRSGGALWIPLVCGVLTSSSYVSLAVGFTYGDAVVVAPIAQLSFVLTGLLAVLFLKERLSFRKGMGVGFAVLSVLLFTTG